MSSLLPVLHAHQIQFLQQQSFSSGMIEAVTRLQSLFPLRIWILDNSHAMLVRDSHRITGQTFYDIHNVSVSRWEELQDCVAYHSQFASVLQLRTRYSLLNAPTVPGLPQYFAVHDETPASSSLQHQQEMDTVRRVMTQTQPAGPAPLIQHLQALQTYLRSIAPQLVSQNHTVSVILTTQGLPTTTKGESGPAVTQQFISALNSFQGLPVWFVIRLCTDDEHVFDFYNSLDSHRLFSSNLEVDVLDDFFGESLEIYLRNPWLTYGLPLHRFREAGFRVHVLDVLDERALTIQEVRQLCHFLFGTKLGPLPDPAQEWNAFFQDVSHLQSREQPQWNPVTRKMTPWINLHDLNRLYGGHPPHPSSFAYQPQYQQQQQQFSPSYQQHPTASGFAAPPPSQQNRPNAPQQAFPNRPVPPPQNQHQQQQQQQQHNLYTNKNSQSSPAPTQMSSSQALQTTISTTWAMLPPQYQQPRPIDYLLATIQTTFPPAFGIQQHAYFDKWKPFSSDALASKQQAVLARAVRKCRFFLHPDRLPQDLDDQQRTLCKTLWDAVSEAWDAAKKE